MLKISKLTDYGTVILSFLALQPEKVLSASRIAKDVSLTLPTVSKLLKILGEAKLVTSVRGTGGGYRLGPKPETITLAQVVTALEGNIAMTECCSTESHCVLDSLCAVKDNWQIINKTILSALAEFTLHDMIRPLSVKQLPTLRGIPIKVKG